MIQTTVPTSAIQETLEGVGALLATQAPHTHPLTGERALAFAVLHDVLHQIEVHRSRSTRRSRRLLREALEYIFADDDLWPFSFLNLCHYLGFDPEYLRCGIRAWQAAGALTGTRREHGVRPPRTLRMDARIR